MDDSPTARLIYVAENMARCADNEPTGSDEQFEKLKELALAMFVARLFMPDDDPAVALASRLRLTVMDLLEWCLLCRELAP